MALRHLLGRERTGASLAALAVLAAGGAVAQAEDAPSARRNVVFVEAGGSTFVGANYERILSPHASLRVGAGVAPIAGATVLAVMPNLIAGSARHQLEAGAGARAVWEQAGRSYVHPAFAGGYRYRTDRRFFFRATAAVDYRDQKLWLTPGASFGLSF